MPFTLECAESFSSSNVTEADIEHAFANDAERGEFIILTAPNGNFIQASSDDAGVFDLEHGNVGTKEHIRATGTLNKEEVRRAFLQFLRGDPVWRSARQWEPLQAKRGCMGMIVLAIFTAALLSYSIA